MFKKKQTKDSRSGKTGKTGKTSSGNGDSIEISGSVLKSMTSVTPDNMQINGGASNGGVDNLPIRASFPGKFDDFTATPADIYENLAYGNAPETDAGVKNWVNAHDGKFGLFINNEWVHPEGRRYRPSVCPATKEAFAETIEAEPEDVDMAMKAARTAYNSWSTLPGHERAKYLYSIARHIQKHMRLLSVVEAMDNGKSFRETKFSDIPLVARHFYHHAGWAQLAEEELRDWTSIGVICEIVPWNFPLMLLAWKVCPALAMGNTVVLKPASYTRLSALLFAEICAEAGLPPGVFNLITGSGRIGSCMADHPETDKIAFTGSTEIGALLRRRVAGSGKKISLELGGKSPVVVFESADLDSAVEGCVDAVWFNQGQVCSAGSRLLIQESVYDRMVAKLKRRIDTFRVSHPLEKDVDMGALVDKSQYDTIKGFCDRAEAEGGEVYKAKVPVPSCGWYWPPTMVLNCSPVYECVREEIFGPVLSVMKFRDTKEAIKLANNTKFGLGASVWTENLALALEVAISIKAGSVWVNAHNLFDAASGFGGYRESGFGRDGGKEGMYEFAKPAWQKRARPDLPMPTTKAEWTAIAPSSPASVTSSNQQNLMSALGNLSVDRTPKVYIGGKQKRPDWQYSRPVYDHKGALLSNVAEGNRKDVRDAVEAAHKAAPGWGKRAAHNRAQICYYIAENLMVRAEEFALRIQVQTGRELQACKDEVQESVDRLFYYAAYADKFGGNVQETQLYGLTASINEPKGVVAIACPEDFPLLGFVSLFAPAVVRGNTVVIVPSQVHPLCATDLYQVFDTSDLPGGVVNIITGDRDFITKTLAEHQHVQAMWYFGTAEGSRNVEFAAADNMKRTWVNYGEKRDWMDKRQGQGLEFLLQSVEVKNVWVPMGDSNSSS